MREHLDLFRSYYPAPLAYAEVVRIAQLEGIEERQFDQLRRADAKAAVRAGDLW